MGHLVGSIEVRTHLQSSVSSRHTEVWIAVRMS